MAYRRGSFIHPFGAPLNAHVHFHCVVTEGVVDAYAIGRVRFHGAQGVGADIVAEVRAKLRRRLLHALGRRERIEREEAQAIVA